MKRRMERVRREGSWMRGPDWLNWIPTGPFPSVYRLKH